MEILAGIVLLIIILAGSSSSSGKNERYELKQIGDRFWCVMDLEAQEIVFVGNKEDCQEWIREQ